MLRTAGIRGGLPPVPEWSVPANLENGIQAHATDLKCSISLALLVEPAVLHGYIFERRYASASSANTSTTCRAACSSEAQQAGLMLQLAQHCTLRFLC